MISTTTTKIVIALAVVYVLLLIASGVWISSERLSSRCGGSDRMERFSLNNVPLVGMCYSASTISGSSLSTADMVTASRMFKYVPIPINGSSSQNPPPTSCFLYLDSSDMNGCPQFQNVNGTLNSNPDVHAGNRPLSSEGGNEAICTYTSYTLTPAGTTPSS